MNNLPEEQQSSAPQNSSAATTGQAASKNLARPRPSGLELRNISKVYKTRSKDVVAVKEANLVIEPGEFVTILGPSGCGKTTNLRMIAGFENPTTGQILLDGKDIVSVPPNKRPMSMVFQSYALFPHLNVEKNISFGLHIKKVEKTELKRRVEVAMEAMDLKQYANRAPHELSGGQQQRVALARALVMEPAVLLFDEPLSNLDAKLRDQMRYEIRRIQQEFGITSVFVTHDQDEAMTMSDKIVVMSAGAIEQVGTPQEVYRHPNSRFVAEFLGTASFFDVTVNSVDEAGNAVIDLQGQSATVPAVENIAPGKGLLMMRAEDFVIDLSGENFVSSTLKVKGKVESNMFHGESIHYQVDVGGEKPVAVQVHGYSAPVKIGQDVVIGIQPNLSWILPLDK